MATSHQAQVSDSDYHNWVRCILGLKYTQEGLYPFIDNEAREFHKNLTANVSAQLGVQSLNCNQCTINSILPNHTAGTCPLRKSNVTGKRKINCICTNASPNRRFCPVDVCGRLYDGIVSAHRYNDPAWRNSDMKLWNVNHWEVAKTFLPSTGGYTQICKAADTDCSGLLNIAINMQDISQRHGISSAPGVFEKCRNARNTILHSSSQKLSDTERDKFIQIMVDVLECTPALKTDQAAQQAVAKLQKVKSDLYTVTDADKTIAKQEVQHMVAEGLERIDDKTAEGLAQVDNKTTEGLALVDDKTAEGLVQVDKKTAEGLAQVDDKTAEGLAQVDKKTAEGLEQVDYKTAEGLAQVDNKTAEGLAQVDNKTAVGLAQVDDKTAEGLAQVDDKTAESLVAIEQTADFKVQQIQEAGDKAYEKEKAEFKQSHIQLVQKRFVPTPVADNMPDMVSVETLFVKPYFEIMDVNAFSGNKANHQKVKSIKDLFFKGDNLCKRIYLTGDAGSGKTTFCKQVAHAWLQIQSETDQFESDNACSEYMDIMKNFDFIFYLPLRSFRHLYRVEEMLQSHFFPNRADFMSKVLSRERCFVVLDGLDEWGPPEAYEQPVSGTYGLPDFGDIYQFSALVTSRPWKLEVLRLKSSEIDLQVRLCEIDETQAEELGQKMIDYLNKATNSEKNRLDFEIHLYEGKVNHLMKIPILLKQLIILWHRRNTFGNSLSHIYSEMIDLMLEQSQARNKGMPLSGPHGSMEESKNVELLQCFEDTQYCPDHVGILYSLAKVAFRTLFNEDQNCSLVFPHNAKVHGFSKPDMELLLKTGILSQHIDFSCDIKKYKCLSFLHKSIQEFLAALYICISDSDACLKQVFQLCKTRDMILQMKSVFVFISGLNGDIAEKIPKFIQNVLESSISENTQIDDYYSSEIMQEFMIECLQESSKLNRLPVWQTEVIHIGSLYPWDRWHVDISMLRHLIQSNDIKRVIVLLSEKISLPELQDCLTDLSSCPSVHTVVLNLHTELSQILITQLCKALLYNRTLTNFDCHSGMSGEPIIKYLRNDDLTALRTLSINIRLYSFSHSDIQVIVQQVSTAAALHTLKLHGIGCSDHGEKCPCILDLTKQTNLQELDFEMLYISQVKLSTSQLTSCTVSLFLTAGLQSSLLQSLHSASSLQTLTLIDILDENIDQVVSLLQCLKNLTNLNLVDINFNERRIRLSPEASHIKRISLFSLNISNESLINFFKTLPATQHKIYVSVFEHNKMYKLKKYLEENNRKYSESDGSFTHDLSFYVIPD